MFKQLLIVTVCLLGAWSWWTSRPVSHGAGIVAPDSPAQEPSVADERFEMGEYAITPLARFLVRARVLAREDYRFDSGADLSPIDLALGWGPMSDESILEHIEISQSNRFYYWSVTQFPIPRKTIETHSANMHLVPANSYIRNALDDVREGQVLELRGYLIRADRSDGWQWQSSLTRDDTGAGACELVWVEDFQLLERSL